MNHTGSLRLGNYLDKLTGHYDCMIVDPPYSERCHTGQSPQRKAIGYEPWRQDDCEQLISWAEEHVSGWWVILTDHVLWAIYERECANAVRYTFAPVPVVFPGCTCRLRGDGPSSWAVYAQVSRPCCLSRWRTLPGAYVESREERPTMLGQKPLDLMVALVRDYSDPGDIIVDPCCGSGTTLRAAQIMGRKWVGCDLDEDAIKTATARMADSFTPEML